MTTIPFAVLFWAEQYMATGTTSLLVATAPLFVGLLTRMDRFQALGTGLSLAGLSLVLLHEAQPAGHWYDGLAAKAAIVLSELAFAYGLVRSKKTLSGGMSLHMYNALQMLVGGTVLLVISFIAEAPLEVEWTWNLAGSIFYLSIMASIVASGIYDWLVQKTAPLFPSTWTILAPLVAMFAGALVLQEAVTPVSIVGTVVTVFGMALVNSNEQRSSFERNVSAVVGVFIR